MVRTSLSYRLVKSQPNKSSQGGDTDRVTNGGMPISLAEVASRRLPDHRKLAKAVRGISKGAITGKCLRKAKWERDNHLGVIKPRDFRF